MSSPLPCASAARTSVEEMSTTSGLGTTVTDAP